MRKTAQLLMLACTMFVLQAHATFNVQGLWWNSAESGWGVNLAHQSDVLFMSWFTYDSTGAGLWMFASGMNKTGTDTYSGQLFQATGSAFDAYDPTRFNQTIVGVASFTFSDANTGTFTYTVGSVTQSKQITRFVVEPGAAALTCTQSGSYGSDPNYSDLWWRSPAGAEPGWGINVAHQNNTIFLSWFTYGADGRGLWAFASNMTRTPGSRTFTGDLFTATGPAFSGPWNAAPVVGTRIGTVALDFTDASNGVFTYIVGPVMQSKSVTRDIFQPAPTICR